MDELIKRLRYCCDNAAVITDDELMAIADQAADAIEELQKRVSKRPHGRLIDADALRAKQQEDADLFQGSTAYGDKCRRDEAMNAVANIVNAPTIIPASFENPTKNARYSQDNPAEEGE